MTAADFLTAINAAAADDPLSPATLSLRLEYAQSLSDAAGSDCQQQLDTAQSQLDQVAARTALEVVLPLARAQIADTTYRIHLARAACGHQTPDGNELAQARDAAASAATLYHDALDYPSSAIMQFNVAATDQKLGDTDGAVTALHTAIAMDRDYGLRQDAQDNTRLLLEWTEGNATDADATAELKDFPARNAAFQFKWSPNDADIALTADDISVLRDKIYRSHAASTLKRHIRTDPEGWAVTNEPGQGTYDLSEWPSNLAQLEWPLAYFLATALLEKPNTKIGSTGDFNSVTDAQAYATTLAQQVTAQVLQRVAWTGTVRGTIADAMSPEFIEARARQDYGLATATWIGAKLDQGAWYQMTTQLFLPGLGLGHYLIQHDIRFAFTRQLPCTADKPDHLCDEIVVHAIPDTKDLQSALKEVGLTDKQAAAVWSRTDMRLVVDPDTLLPYASEVTRNWYDDAGKADPMIESLRTIATMAYH